MYLFNCWKCYALMFNGYITCSVVMGISLNSFSSPAFICVGDGMSSNLSCVNTDVKYSFS